VPARFDDEAPGGAQDEAVVDKRPPLPRKPSDASEDDEISDELDE